MLQNRLVGKSEKANPVILYKNELGLNKQTITQELNGLKLPGDQVWLLMRYKSRKVISPMHVHLRFSHYTIFTFHALYYALSWNANYSKLLIFVNTSYVVSIYLFPSKNETLLKPPYFQKLQIEMFTLQDTPFLIQTKTKQIENGHNVSIG